MAISSINTNIASYYAQTNIGRASDKASSSIARLSSGNRIVKASDDVAALSIGTSLRTGVTTLKTALLNASQGSSLLQVADGALSQISEILQRQKAIATQAGSGSLGATERGFLNQEFQNLTAEVDRIASTTNFNGVKLINGGLGSKTRLANDENVAAYFDPTSADGNAAGFAAVSTSPIQAFNKTTGASAATYTTAAAGAGAIDITDSTGALLTGSYDAVNSALYGQFSSFKLSDVVYGAAAAGSAKLTATINGVEFTGALAGGGTDAILSNGSTYIRVGLSAASSFSDASAAEFTINTLTTDFRDVVLMRTSQVQGINFEGTRLAGVTGAAAAGGISMVRLSDGSKSDISNFRLGGVAGAGATTLLVDVNGKTFQATDVVDALAAGNILVFQDDTGQALQINLTGLTTDFTDVSGAAGDLQQRVDLVNALNQGFSRAGSGLTFQVGSTSSDSLRVSLSSASTVNLYNGQSLDVATAESAATAVNALDQAIGKVTALRADVGAAQSRFNFASANLETSIQNQDAARGVLLDTDVTAESTAYATAQVQLQAGIAVLAQANQLPQNLLKLIS